MKNKNQKKIFIYFNLCADYYSTMKYIYKIFVVSVSFHGSYFSFENTLLFLIINKISISINTHIRYVYKYVYIFKAVRSEIKCKKKNADEIAFTTEIIR